jgi:hypothetical protein
VAVAQAARQIDAAREAHERLYGAGAGH